MTTKYHSKNASIGSSVSNGKAIVKNSMNSCRNAFINKSSNINSNNTNSGKREINNINKPSESSSQITKLTSSAKIPYKSSLLKK